MTSVERIGEQSREQHHRYYGLFGPDPVNGDGFAELHASIRELGQQAADVHAYLARTGFTSAAEDGLAAARLDDHNAFSDAAAIASAAAAAADGSAQLNLRGAAAIAAYMEGEAAMLSAIPDQGSPDGMMQSLAAIDNHQTKSLSTVEQFAATAQDLGRFAHMAGTHTVPTPPQLSQLSEGHPLAAVTQITPAGGFEHLAQPLAAAPLPSPPTEHSPDLGGNHDYPSATIESVRDSAHHELALDTPATDGTDGTDEQQSVVNVVRHHDAPTASPDSRLNSGPNRAKPAS